MFKALLWKDYRVNRLPLLAGLFFFVTPIAALVLINLWAEHRYGGPYYAWATALTMGPFFGLTCSLITLAMLGGTAFACERADRSAEFLAPLPVNRKHVIISKAVIAAGPGILIWACGLLLIMVVAPRTIGNDPDLGESIVDARHRLLPILVALSISMFGSAWLGSSFLPSHAIATGLSFGFPILVFGILRAIEFGLEEYEFTIRWLPTVLVVLGIAGFLGGIIIYVRRLND